MNSYCVPFPIVELLLVGDTPPPNDQPDPAAHHAKSDEGRFMWAAYIEQHPIR